jgi:putative nucleotidyltransferase with HDIG domain
MPEKDCTSEKPSTIRDLTCWGLSQLAHPFDSSELIRSVLESLRMITGSERVDLLLYQSDMNILFFTDTQSGDQNGGGKLSLADTKNSVPVEALIGGHTVTVDDVRDSGFVSLSLGARALLSIPLIFDEQIHGVLSLEHSKEKAYSEETVRWVQGLCGFISALLERNYLTEKVFRLNQKLIDQMTIAASEGDPGYKAHAERVSSIAGAIAQEMGLSPEIVRAVRDSGYLHDIGKSGVNQSILVKPGSLDHQEMHEVKRHPVLGRFLLKPLGFQPIVIEGVVSHHERWDGTGYPRGLSGKQIPVAGRILAVAEAYDVMTSDQPYRKSVPKEQAIQEIKSQISRQFDPEVVEALLRVNEL